MDQEVAAPPGAGEWARTGRCCWRRRIFARLREGLSYEEIATEEGVTGERIRQIVAEVLQKRSVDSGADHREAAIGPSGAGGAGLPARRVAAGDYGNRALSQGARPARPLSDGRRRQLITLHSDYDSLDVTG